MAKKRDRAIAGFFAALFIASVLIGSAAVVYAIMTADDQQANTQEVPKVDPDKQLQGKPLANFTPVAKIEKLEKQDVKEGTGKTVQASDTVTVHYTGALASNGVVFESSKDTNQPATFPLNRVIPGWTQGVPGMKEGGTRRLLIPASLAYGAQGSPPTIPPNADLVFDIELQKVGQ